MIEQPSRSFLDRTHSSLEVLQSRANVTERVFTGLTSELRAQIKVGMQDYPESFRVEVKNPPSYRATVITPNSLHESPQPKVGVVFLPGFGGRAAGTAHVISELYQKLPDHLTDSQVSLAASLSSSISQDLETNSFAKSHLERATHYAVFITELLIQNPYPVDKLQLVAHSLSGMEASYMMPILKSLLRQNNLKTQIAGLVLAQPGGMYDQNRLRFMFKRMPEVISFEGEIAEMFPTIFDIQRVKDELGQAQVQQDSGRVMALKQQLLEMEQKRQNPPHLIPEQKQALLQIDQALESPANSDGKMTKSLIRHRKKLLKPVIKEVLQGADIRQEENPRPLSLIQFLVANFLPGRKGIASSLPEAIIHGLDKVPVALVFGEQDGYFKLKEYQEYLNKQATKGKHPLQASARRFIAEIANWPHIAPATNPAKFANIVGDIFKRMDEPSTSQITELQY